MKTRLFLAFIVGLLVTSSAFAQDTWQVRFRKDTTVIKIYGDSAYIKRSQSGQLNEWILRNNDYGSIDGIHIETKTPDGDSISSGLWLSGDRKVYLISGHQSKLVAAPTGTQLYGNYILNPSTGGTYPFFVLKNSSSDSTWLSMAANGLPQWNRSINLPNSFPASPATGDFGRTGNILYFQASTGKFGIDFGTAPSVGMGLRYAGGGIWSPGYPDTGAVGGGAGSSRWDSLTAPGDTAFLNMSVYKTVLSFGEVVNAPAFRITSTGGGYSDALFQVDVGTGDAKNIAKFVNGSGDGVQIGNTGGLAPVGSGSISANKWMGLDTVSRSNLPNTTVFNNKVSTFTARQVMTTSTETTQPMLYVTNSNAAVGADAIWANSENGTAVNAWAAQGYAIEATSEEVAIYANSLFSSPQRWAFNSIALADMTSAGLIPATTGGIDLGSEAKHFGDVHTDSLFVGATKSAELMWRGDGAMVRFKDTTGVFVTDTLTLNWSWVDSTYNATWGFIGKAGIIASPGGKCYNNGNVELTSTSGPMVGSYVWVSVRKRN